MTVLLDQAAEEASAFGEIGFVTSINGSKVTLDLAPRAGDSGGHVTVGSFVGIRAGSAYAVGVVTTLAAQNRNSASARDLRACAEIDLLGEIVCDRWGAESFRRGVASYPSIGDRVGLLSSYNLRLVFQAGAADIAEIGSLYLDSSMPAVVKIDELISRHFAVLGTTGVGKSSGVAVILDQVLTARPDLRVFLLDVHNEYAKCFGERVNVINHRTLKLPFWLFNLEETVDVIFGGRPAVDEEIEILAELIPLAKNKYTQYKDTGDRGLVKRALTRASFTVETPVPYVLQDLVALIDERMGKLENRSARMHYHRLIGRIEALRNDPRYGFMIENANVGGDMMGELLAHLFRFDCDAKPMTVMQLAGLPSEVVDAVVCVLCRLAFKFGVWSDGAMPLLFVCEEAHRYASADRSIGFMPTRRALSRIAKEGRKHGVYLGLVTQRPAELDPIIISQCSTLFAMRMANERDQAFLHAAVTDAANLLAFVPLLGTGEVIAFGEGVPLPARMTFRHLPRESLPRAESASEGTGLDEGLSRTAFVNAVVERWRGATTNGNGAGTMSGNGSGNASGKPGAEPETAVARLPREGAPENAGVAALDQVHRRLLRRPLDLGEGAEPARREPSSDGAVWQLR